MNSMPLRYRISSWYQLPKCLSNNSKDLKIRVANYCNNTNVRGIKITVEHPAFGVLFSYLLNANGDYISQIEGSELDTATILKQLAKFGFLIEISDAIELPPAQVDYLSTIDRLGFDKLRLLAVYPNNYKSVSDAKVYCVVFNSADNPMWLSNSYTCGVAEFDRVLTEGTALNITEISKQKGFNWTWLDYVANIKDLLDDTFNYEYDPLYSEVNNGN